MRQSRLWIEIAVFVIVAAAAFFIGRAFPYSTAPAAQGPAPVAAVDEGQQSDTRYDVPAGTVVPGMDESNLPPEVAKPETVKTTAGEDSPYLRTFTLKVSNNTVAPSNIIAKAGDILTITFESADKAYDFVQPDHGLSWQVPAGGAKKFQFQASNEGKYIFYCPSCGGPDAGPTGYFTIVK